MLAFFGGFRQTEIADLKLEKFTSEAEGVYIIHERAKQRSDKRESKFLVPRMKTEESTDYAGILEYYLRKADNKKDKHSILLRYLSFAIDLLSRYHQYGIENSILHFIFILSCC